MLRRGASAPTIHTTDPSSPNTPASSLLQSLLSDDERKRRAEERLLDAIVKQKQHTALVFVERGARGDCVLPGKAYSALHLISRHGMCGVLAAIASHRQERPIAFDTRDQVSGSTPLIDALQAKQELVAAILIEEGADVTKCSYAGTTVLEAAAMRCSLATVEALVAAGACINRYPQPKWSAIRLAAYGGHADVVRWLLRHGADLIGFENDYLPLHKLSSNLETQRVINGYIMDVQRRIITALNPSYLFDRNNMLMVHVYLVGEAHMW